MSVATSRLKNYVILFAASDQATNLKKYQMTLYSVRKKLQLINHIKRVTEKKSF